MRGPKGWQVMKVLDVDQSTAIAVAPKAPAVPDGIAMGEYITALVKWYNNERGYGFVATARSIHAIFSCRSISPVKKSFVPASPYFVHCSASSRSSRMIAS